MTEALHVRGVILPEGDQGDLYVAGGRITYEPVADATNIAAGLGPTWIVPGLVDAHCHVGLDTGGAVGPDTQERQALANRAVGAVLLRDCGSAADTRWIDGREDLPQIIRAGRHLARPKRYLRNYAYEIEPAELATYVAQEAERGDGWVKLVGDWIDRELGELAPLWPRDALDAAIATAHRLGARVTAHVFGEHALPDLIAAGIDCIEHGTGLTPDLIDDMVAGGVTLVPTAKQLESFPTYVAQAEPKFPAYARHLRALHERRRDTIAAAYEAGVPIFAGTDAGGVLPHGLIAAEVQELATYGLSAFDALAAASWRAREWLGHAGHLAEGVKANFVVYDADPLADLAVLSAPKRIVLRGRVVA